MREGAKRLAAALRLGDLLCLDGELGAGKTTFVQAVGAALGIQGAMPSPTFSLVRRYETPKGTLHHLDLYRLASPEEVEALDFEALFWPEDGFTFIEWAERAGDYLPKKAARLVIVPVPGPTGEQIRSYTLQGETETARRLRRALEAQGASFGGEVPRL